MHLNGIQLEELKHVRSLPVIVTFRFRLIAVCVCVCELAYPKEFMALSASWWLDQTSLSCNNAIDILPQSWVAIG